MSHVFPIATRTGKSNDFKGYHINSFYETDMFLLLVCWLIMQILAYLWFDISSSVVGSMVKWHVRGRGKSSWRGWALVPRV